MSQKCTFCDKEKVPPLTFVHIECQTEHTLRHSRSMCTKCNEKPRNVRDSSTNWCDTCKVDDVWKGYENCFKG